MPFPGRDLEEENKALRAEIECLRKVLASNGLTSASAITHRHNSDLPKVPKQPEDSEERIDMKMCNRCARLARSRIWNKLNIFSGIDFTLAFRRGSKSAAFFAECFLSGPQGELPLILWDSCVVPGGGLEPPRPCGLRILSPLRLPISPSGLIAVFLLTPSFSGSYQNIDRTHQRFAGSVLHGSMRLSVGCSGIDYG
jgi:hypothetical protein